GVVFMGTDQGLKEYPEIFRKHFGTVVPAEDNKFSALNSAVWSGGSFVYVPKGVEVPLPLQAYFRINGENTGQFERTLIVVDTGAKAIPLAPNTRSRIASKSVSKDGGRTSYRGHLKVSPGATGVVASVRCDALMLDDQSRSDTYPYIDIQEDDTTMTHEATVGKISQDQVFYLMSRGLTENEAQNLVIQGFLEVFTK